MSDTFENNELYYGSEFSANLLKFRKKCGFTQQQLADMLGLNRTTYTKYETGVSEPSIETIKKLSVLLDVDVNSLLLGEEFNARMSEEISPVFMMNDDETELLSMYRTLSSEDKSKVKDGLLKLSDKK